MDGPAPNDPTPEEIAAACLAFQAGWSKIERRRRRSLFQLNHAEAEAADADAIMPVVPLCEFASAIADAG